MKTTIIEPKPILDDMTDSEYEAEIQKDICPNCKMSMKEAKCDTSRKICPKCGIMV